MAVPLTNLLKGIDKQDRKGKLMRWGKLSESESSRIKREFALQWTATCEQALMFRASKCALHASACTPWFYHILGVGSCCSTVHSENPAAVYIRRCHLVTLRSECPNGGEGLPGM
jgi:hypothetical protein